MTIPQWVQWAIASLSAGSGMIIFMFSTFVTKAEIDQIKTQQEKIEMRIEKLHEKMDIKLDKIDLQIERALDRKK